MIEIEFSALYRLCLNRRIPTIELLESELMAIINDQQKKCIKINWQFSIIACRDKFKSFYSTSNPPHS